MTGDIRLPFAFSVLGREIGEIREALPSSRGFYNIIANRYHRDKDSTENRKI